VTKLTDLMVRNLTPDGTRREIFEGNGFGLRVSAKGIKSFIFVYYYGGKSRRLTLGQYPTMGLSDAREAFKAAHEA